MKHVDLFVIGGGSGGVRAARIAAGHGASVALAEEYRMGGTCVIRGCVPKKLMVMASRFVDEFEAARAFGWSLPAPGLSWTALMGRVHAEVNRLETVYTSNLAKAGVQIHAQRAVLLDAHTVQLQASGEKIHADTILIATGAQPTMPEDIPGAALADSSNEFFLWQQQPAKVVVQGAGYIALELACLLRRLGSEVTVVMRGDRVLRGFDDQVRSLIQDQLIADGLRIEAGRSIGSIESARSGHGLTVTLDNGSILQADKVLRAMGRHPNTTGLGLERVGVTLDAAGAIAVDDYSATSIGHIFAVGDVTNRITLTPAAIREGHAFADSRFGKTPRSHGIEVIPTAVFTTPEIGTVGLTEAQARERHPAVDIYTTRFRPMKVAMAGGTQQCFMKIIVARDSDKVLGVHIIGPEAGEMIQLVGVALQAGATKRQFDATLAVHPTLAEELVTMRTPNA